MMSRRRCRRSRRNTTPQFRRLAYSPPFLVIWLMLMGALHHPNPTQAFFWPDLDEGPMQSQSFDDIWEGANLNRSQMQHIPIAGYLPDYEPINLNETVKHLDDLILFSVEVHSRGMVGGCCLNAEHYQAAKVARENFNPNLRLWVTVGGKDRTQAVGEVIKDPQKRYKFMQSMIRLCKREGIQGIDLDWMSAIRNQEEKQHHLQFLKEATKVWHNHGLLVSVPLHVQQELPQWAYDSLDRINLMVYDSPPLPEGTVEKWGNHVVRVAHAHHALKILVETGCPAHKIWLGIPFYGQQWDPPKKVQTYDEVAGRVMHEFKNAGVELNDLTYSPLVEMVGRFEGYQWDTPSVIIEKMSYVHTRALGGVFIWELGQDLRTRDAPAGVILTGMSAVAKRRDWRFVVDDRTQEEHMKEYMNIKAREMLLERRKEKEEAARNEKEDAARNEL